MKNALLVLAAGLALLGSPARAAVTFEYLFDDGYPLGVSVDGSVVTGNSTTGFVPFRWTQATGFVSLGRPTFVGGGGKPGISADGTRIASSIGSLDSSYTTMGLWTQQTGWQELMPPQPPDGTNQDGTFGNVYDLSGDGNTVVGLYPRAGGRAHACKWTQAGGAVDLGGTVNAQASRANGVNYDASVIVGWVETPTGPWRPAAWVNGSLVLLSYVNPAGTSINGTGEARAVSPNGDIIVGFMSDSLSHQRAATMWKRVGGVFGAPRVLGWVDGTTPGAGINLVHAVSADGRIAVGYCSFDGDPFFTTGFVWTEETGVLDVNAFLANNGVPVDPNFTIQNLTALTPDGTNLYGYGMLLTPPYTRRAFRIHVPNTAGAPHPVASTVVEMSAPAPNPSTRDTHLEFSLATACTGELSIYDASGRRVATLLRGELAPGRRTATWDGREANGNPVPAGLYFARLATTAGSAHRRIVRVQ